ncbi:MAG: selenocysteine-specific translation elongation factor [Sarcina sp.]
MKHIIIGTAGHIDHGKTALVKALTGVDTDTLEEEKKRGITINNGYTYFKLNDETLAGIIDVPGHEKFIKNMVAGVSSIDIVMLVIASDEGIMPQTREHMDILNLLNIKKGIVVLTKSDLVDSEWTDFMKEEVRDFLSNTFMKDAKIVSVSSKTGEGIKELCEVINEEVSIVEEKDKGEIFRFPIDRVFKVKGFGTVVTGSVLGGSVSVSDELELLIDSEESVKVKVRGIQVHGKERDIAVAGERAAINIVCYSKKEPERGMFLSEIGKQQISYMTDIKLKVLDSYEGKLENRQRVRVYHYAKEVMARVVLLDKEELSKGEESFVQLRLEEEISAKVGDKIVIRSYSPMHTIAGGTVLDATPRKAKRFREEYITALKMKESGDIKTQIENIIQEKSKEFITLKEVASILNTSEDEIRESVEILLSDKRLVRITDEVFFHNRYILKLENNLDKLFKEFYVQNPLKLGMNKDALRNKLIEKKIKNDVFDIILEILRERNSIDIKGSIVYPKNYEIKLNKEQSEIKKFILSEYENYKFVAPRFEDIIKTQKNKKDCKLVLSMLIEDGTLIYLEENLYVLSDLYEEAKLQTIEFIKEKGMITLSDLKEIIDTSRRYLVAFLEKLDKEKVTKREGEGRVLA